MVGDGRPVVYADSAKQSAGGKLQSIDGAHDGATEVRFGACRLKSRRDASNTAPQH